MPDAHAEYAPSASDRWMGCVGSTQLIRKLMAAGKIKPQKDTIATASGTGMHDRAEHHLLEETDPKADKTPVVYKVGKKEYSIDSSEWHTHVVGYVEKVREIAEEMEFFAGEKPTIVVEGKVTIVGDQCWGSVDVYIYAGEVLYVIDLKTGRGHIVSAEENSQFMTYAAGICIEHKWKFKEIHLCRWQAPDHENPFDDWLTDVVTLQSWVTKIRKTIKESEKGTAPLSSGDHCLWCPAKPECPEQYNTAMTVFDDDEMLPEAAGLKPEQLLFLLKHADVIKKYLTEIQAYAVERSLEDADAVPGFKVVEGRSNRTWNKSEPEIIMALQLEGVDMSDLYEDPKLKSFTKVEKVIGKKEFAELDLVMKPAGKPTLVPLDDKRKPINALAFEGFDD